MKTLEFWKSNGYKGCTIGISRQSQVYLKDGSIMVSTPMTDDASTLTAQQIIDSSSASHPAVTPTSHSILTAQDLIDEVSSWP